ncbi:MAG: hypothetical protein ABI120_19770 [Gemmatimonadaceae bacterium]
MTRSVRIPARIARVIPAVCVLVAPSATSAQSKSVPVRCVTTPVNSTEPFAFVPPTVRGLPGGQLLVNDQRGKRLVVFDSTLASFTIIADSAGTRGVRYPYPRLNNPLMRYIGDSSLMRYIGDSSPMADFEAGTYLVIDPGGKIARAMAPPIAAYSVPRIPQTVVTTLPNGISAGSLVVNPGLCGPDEFAVLSDGTLGMYANTIMSLTGLVPMAPGLQLESCHTNGCAKPMP